ncbi:flagellar biosynthetic protein FliR [Actimicrobium sp. CCC2.4]|uniref:flagellar biosynthetic protein FliR n=1 Tax=Actimicrobium sp. CCC2.4 TaxID=3048606 RepID=UPI002AC9DE17|nr:flagellar biosynthetic protein FliR [Actimicrobium sp. CCC2.4]MEB0135239.1 flagellar biosynthetic protein FliR [Actimicrobium sp. CCC2.4]WPX31033.1 flagellar biosynthetic protein FliR [Actimicrobium sp. CCC2.4]
MLNFSSAELNALITGFLWPLTRILGLIAVAPVFGNASVPRRVKVGLGILIAMIVAPLVQVPSGLEPMSMQGLLILVQQLLIGIAMGFSMRIIFSAVEMAGEVASMTMGLGFATFFDPQSRGRSNAVSQFLSLIVLMVYLAANVHLALLSTLVDSFATMPITVGPLTGNIAEQVVRWASRLFSAGLQLSLPIVAALLITNVALGILTRAAPSLNLFGIGFPITLAIGFTMLGLTLPYLATPMAKLFEETINTIRQLTGG